MLLEDYSQKKTIKEYRTFIAETMDVKGIQWSNYVMQWTLTYTLLTLKSTEEKKIEQFLFRCVIAIYLSSSHSFFSPLNLEVGLLCIALIYDSSWQKQYWVETPSLQVKSALRTKAKWMNDNLWLWEVRDSTDMRKNVATQRIRSECINNRTRASTTLQL